MKITLRKYLEGKNIFVTDKILGVFIANLSIEDAESLVDGSYIDGKFEEQELDKVYEICKKSGYISKRKTKESVIFKAGKSNFVKIKESTKKCEKCGNEINLFLLRPLNVIYQLQKDKVCYDCFAEELKERDLTEKEIELLIKDRDNKEFVTPWNMCLTNKQFKTFCERYKVFKDKEKNDKYHKMATDLIEKHKNCDDITGVVAEILKYIDNKTKYKNEVYFK